MFSLTFPEENLLINNYMRSPLLSIIIPIFNKGKYIESCLKSIFEQSFQDFEVVIINDGSTDDSDYIIRKMQEIEPRLKYYTFSNSGVSIARNRGIQRALGDFLMFIDADDWIESGYLERIMSKAQQYEADVYIWGVTKETNGHLETLLPNIFGFVQSETFWNALVQGQYLHGEGLYGYVANKLIHRKFVEDNQLAFNQKLQKLEDYDFFLDYYNLITTAYIFDESGYHYIQGTDNSSKYMVIKVDYISILDIHLKCIRILAEKKYFNINNQHILGKIMMGLSVSAFQDLSPVRLSSISYLLQEIDRRNIVNSFFKYKCKYALLKAMIIHKNKVGLLIYLTIWNIYLKIRRNFL